MQEKREKQGNTVDVINLFVVSFKLFFHYA